MVLKKLVELKSETEYAMPAKDSGTSGTATRLASWLTMESAVVVQGNSQWQLGR